MDPEIQNVSAGQTGKLVASDGDKGDEFGASVAVSADGTTAVVGAYDDEDPSGTPVGSTYVFERADGTWNQRAKLVSEDGDEEDRFGSSVAVSADGTTILVGAPGDEDPNGDESGSVYVFEPTNGTWDQQAKLVPDDGDENDLFGLSVALSDDGKSALVGAYDELDSGSAYIFSHSGENWRQEAKLTPEESVPGDNFGSSVALSADGTTAIVGRFENITDSLDSYFAVQVFERAGGTWSRQTEIVPDNSKNKNAFGHSVALSGDGTTALIGSNSNNNPNGTGAGLVYVFTQSGNTWLQSTKLLSEDGDEDDLFGSSIGVSADGTTAVIGARGDEDPNGTGAGSAYLFKQSNGNWNQQRKLVPDDGGESDEFGGSVSVSADSTTAIIGATGVWKPDEDEDFAGAAYSFFLGL
jgi:hypothetical protein